MVKHADRNTRQKHAIPLYYFCPTNGQSVIDDNEGTDLPSPDAARHEAELDVEELRQARISGRRSWVGWAMRVTNEVGAVLFELPFEGRPCAYCGQG